MDIEAAVAEMVADVESRGWMGTKYKTWIIGEGTRLVGLAEPLKFKMACRILVKAGITLDELARRHS